MDPVGFAFARASEAVKGGTDGDGHGAGAADSGPGGGFGVGGQGEAALGLKEFNDFGQQGQFVALAADQLGEGDKTFAALVVSGDEADVLIAGRKGLDAAGGVAGDGGVYGDRARVEEIERPDIESAAGEVDASGSFGFNAHKKGRQSTIES
jgi:hypothetical protein